MTIAHQLGFPHIGANRETKWAVERYWKGEISRDQLEEEGKRIRADNWARQIKAGHDFITVGDFSWYDHILDLSALLGVVPARFATEFAEVDLDTYFRMARGRAQQGADTRASEMTKWFDTNYHYLVPEFSPQQVFKISSQRLFSEIKEAQEFKKAIKPVLVGPLTYLWLGKSKEANFDKLSLLDKLLSVYAQVLRKLHDLGIEWVQIDEPILVLDLPITWQEAFKKTYQQLSDSKLKILLATYFGHLGSNTELACHLPVEGLHIDAVRAPEQISDVLKALPEDKILSVGIVDGRNIWRTDLRKALETLKPIKLQLKDRLWVGSSCSLLHCPVDLETEKTLAPEIKNWLAFATQKLTEINLLKRALTEGESGITKELSENNKAIESRRTSARIHKPEIKKRLEKITPEMTQRNQSYTGRKKVQSEHFKLPLFPTTTIGSFPQTQDIRNIRHDFKLGKLDENTYRQEIFRHISHAVYKQLDLGLDVLVHGESERNDMVEYFGELLEGFAFTQNGWVQSYGSRCVKPPIIYGDVNRPHPMTIEWISYAQSLTEKPVKGMLTGPITILCWSFVRDDQPRFETAKQIAIALRDEVADLAKAGIQFIQIDEPAFREGLPLREKDWQEYLKQAVYCFRLASCCVPDSTQIHTHMCYSEFNDIIEAIADLDADVITIETSRSDMELLKAFEKFKYPNDIGPGVYDIHSPCIPSVYDIVTLIDKAAKLIPIQQLWVNPDCGLKTRDWAETDLALKHMVSAAQILRVKYMAKERAEAAS